jgi:hexokinase
VLFFGNFCSIETLRQERIDHGQLISWAVGYSAPNTEGHDVADMFRRSLAKYVGIEINALFTIREVDSMEQNLPVRLTALINDTTGTLIASHYMNSRTKIAAIFGTGWNVAYMERVREIEKISSLDIDPTADMVINCELVRVVLMWSIH